MEAPGHVPSVPSPKSGTDTITIFAQSKTAPEWPVLTKMSYPKAYDRYANLLLPMVLKNSHTRCR